MVYLTFRKLFLQILHPLDIVTHIISIWAYYKGNGIAFNFFDQSGINKSITPKYNI